MAKHKLFITDTRMLMLMEWAIDQKLAKNEADYLNQIDFPRQNISRIKSGDGSFTKEHILRAASLTGASIDWLFGLQEKMLRVSPVTTIERLREVVMELEAKFPEKETSARQRSSRMERTKRS